MTPTHTAQPLALGAVVRLRTGQVGKVVAHNPNDRSRVLVSVWDGWQGLQPRGFDVAALTVLEVVNGVTTAEEAA